jgi:predicted aspartyl protease
MMQPFSSSRFPYLPVHVEILTPEGVGFEFDIEPLVDTGFDGSLAVPTDLIPDAVTPIGQAEFRLSDETEISTFSYFGYVTLGQLPPVPAVVIALAEESLLGRQVTNNFRLIFDHGNQVIVEP